MGEAAGKKKAAAKTGTKKKVREKWSPAKHSLTALLEKARVADDQIIHLVDDQRPHVIDLLDPLGVLESPYVG